jgi:hypothetical protein
MLVDKSRDALRHLEALHRHLGQFYSSHHREPLESQQLSQAFSGHVIPPITRTGHRRHYHLSNNELYSSHPQALSQIKYVISLVLPLS